MLALASKPLGPALVSGKDVQKGKAATAVVLLPKTTLTKGKEVVSQKTRKRPRSPVEVDSSMSEIHADSSLNSPRAISESEKETAPVPRRRAINVEVVPPAPGLMDQDPMEERTTALAYPPVPAPGPIFSETGKDDCMPRNPMSSYLKKSPIINFEGLAVNLSQAATAMRELGRYHDILIRGGDEIGQRNAILRREKAELRSQLQEKTEAHDKLAQDYEKLAQEMADLKEKHRLELENTRKEAEAATKKAEELCSSLKETTSDQKKKIHELNKRVKSLTKAKDESFMLKRKWEVEKKVLRTQLVSILGERRQLQYDNEAYKKKVAELQGKVASVEEKAEDVLEDVCYNLYVQGNLEWMKNYHIVLAIIHKRMVREAAAQGGSHRLHAKEVNERFTFVELDMIFRGYLTMVEEDEDAEARANAEMMPQAGDKQTLASMVLQSKGKQKLDESHCSASEDIELLDVPGQGTSSTMDACVSFPCLDEGKQDTSAGPDEDVVITHSTEATTSKQERDDQMCAHILSSLSELTAKVKIRRRRNKD